MLDTALYQLHDKDTLNLEITRPDAVTLASGLGRLRNGPQKEVTALAERIGRAAVGVDPRQSVSVPCASDRIAGLLSGMKAAAKTSDALEEQAVAHMLEARVDMNYKYRMNSELKRLLTFRERGWKYKYVFTGSP